MEATGVWRGGFESHLEDGRGHGITIDLPTDEGGSNLGTSALELAVESLAGCITTLFAMIAHKRNLTFDRLAVSLTADRPEGAPTIRRVHGTLEVSTREPRESVDTVLRLALKTCPVGVLFERAHVPVHVRLVLRTPTTPGPDGLPYQVPEPEWKP